jgi:formate dehydrogenase maturation protein FdhE
VTSPITKDNAFKKKVQLKYRKDGHCPFCDHDGVTLAKEINDDNIVSRRIRCDLCLKEWWEIFNMTHIEPSDGL